MLKGSSLVSTQSNFQVDANYLIYFARLLVQTPMIAYCGISFLFAQLALDYQVPARRFPESVPELWRAEVQGHVYCHVTSLGHMTKSSNRIILTYLISIAWYHIKSRRLCHINVIILQEKKQLTGSEIGTFESIISHLFGIPAITNRANHKFLCSLGIWK